MENKKVEFNKKANSGINELTNPSLTFVRKFRWIFEGDNLSEFLIKDVAFNFSKSTIKFSAYETVIAGDSDVTIQKWIDQDLTGKHLKFTVYDGCGNALYTYKFYDLLLISDKCDFDYAVSDASCRKLKVRYGKFEKKTFIPEENTPQENTPQENKPQENKPQKFEWRVSVNDISKIKLKDADRPNVYIEEKEVNFLESKAFIPGNLHWAEISIKLNQNNYVQFMKALASEPLEPNIKLLLCQQEGKVLESWELDKATISGLSKLSNDLHEIKLKYDGVQYILGDI